MAGGLATNGRPSKAGYPQRKVGISTAPAQISNLARDGTGVDRKLLEQIP